MRARSGSVAGIVLAGFERAYAQIARFAPFSARDLGEPGARETFRAVCLAGLERHGLAGLLREGSLECIDLLRAVVRARGAARSPRRALTVAPLWRDLRLASRSLVAGGSTSLIAVGTLALGIGINAAVFSVLDAVVWRQVPFREATRLVELWSFSKDQKFSFRGFSPPLVQQWQGQTDLFDRVEAYDRESFIHETARGSEMVAGAVVTDGLFELLGVNAARGRTFVAGEGRAGGSRAVVISDAFWRKRLGAPLDIGSITVGLNGARYRVAGVMPASFRFPSGAEEIWTVYGEAQPPTGARRAQTLTPYGRLAPGVLFETASHEVASRGERLSDAAGGPPGMTATLMRTTELVSDERTQRSVWALAGAVAFLFLLVCANVANLALSRSLSRTRVLATCSALGASPFDLVRTTVLEQVLLATAGAVAGAGVAALALRLAVAALPDAITAGTLNVIDLDPRALVFMMGAGVAAAMLFGLPPAIMAARTSLTGALGRDGRTSAGSRQARRARSALAIVEVAVSIVLLVGAAVMTRSFVKLATADQGYDARGLISLRLGLPAAGYQDVALRDRAAIAIVDRIALVPGVSGVTVGGLPSETNMVSFGKIEFDHRPGELTPPIMVPMREVPANYFRVLGIPIVSGRAFREDDVDGAVIVNRRFSAMHFRAGDAVGRRFRVEAKPWRTIVGVAGDTLADGERGTRRVEMYYPIGKASNPYRPTMLASVIADFRTLVVRSDRPETVIRQLPGAVHEHDPSIVIWNTALVEHLIGDAIARPRVVFVMMAVCAGFGLVLAMAGLYGVLSCLVAQRRQELGVRLALGASAANVRWLVLGNGLALTGIGTVIGLAAALPLVNAMRALLYEVEPADPVAMIGAALLLCITAAFACWWPARSAGRINPLELLRGV